MMGGKKKKVALRGFGEGPKHRVGDPGGTTLGGGWARCGMGGAFGRPLGGGGGTVGWGNGEQAGGKFLPVQICQGWTSEVRAKWSGFFVRGFLARAITAIKKRPRHLPSRGGLFF